MGDYSSTLSLCVCIACKGQGFTAMADNNTVFCNLCGMDYKFAGDGVSPPTKCIVCGHWSCYCSDEATDWKLNSHCCVCQSDIAD